MCSVQCSFSKRHWIATEFLYIISGAQYHFFSALYRALSVILYRVFWLSCTSVLGHLNTFLKTVHWSRLNLYVWNMPLLHILILYRYMMNVWKTIWLHLFLLIYCIVNSEHSQQPEFVKRTDTRTYVRAKFSRICAKI